MDVLKALEVEYEAGDYRRFRAIEKDGVSLSVQASYGHYCSPRLTLEDLSEYSTMEFAILRDDEFIEVKDILPDIPELEVFDRYFEGSVYGYVPVQLINEVYKNYFI